MARNYALDKCNGNYITFIDSDDVYHPERLKKMMQIFVQNPDCDIVFSRHKEFRGELGVDDTRETGSVKINNGNIQDAIEEERLLLEEVEERLDETNEQNETTIVPNTF